MILSYYSSDSGDLSYFLLRTLYILSLFGMIGCGETAPPAQHMMSESGEMSAGEVDAGEVSAGEMSAGEVNAGEISAGEMSAGEVSAGEIEAGDPISPPDLNITGCSPDLLEAVQEPQDLTRREERTEIHPHVVWDGEAFWVAWSVANMEGKFETWAGRFSCDLTPLIAPFAVEQVTGVNDLDPSIAVRGETVMIVWSRDDSFMEGGMYNLSTRIATFDRTTGTSLHETHSLEISVIDAPHAQAAFETPPGEISQGNLWMVSLAAHAEVGFVVVGSWGDPERNTFRVYLQYLNDEGQPLGSAWLADPEGGNQTYPEVSVSAYGVIDVTWVGGSALNTSGAWGRSWRNEVVTSIRAYSDEEGSGVHTMRSPELSYEEGLVSNPPRGDEIGAPWSISTSGSGRFNLSTPETSLGGLTPSRPFMGVRFAPELLIGYQRIRGTAHELWWRPLSTEGWGEAQLIADASEPAAPYPLATAPYQGGTLVVWAAGENPEFQLKATHLRAQSP